MFAVAQCDKRDIVIGSNNFRSPNRWDHELTRSRGISRPEDPVLRVAVLPCRDGCPLTAGYSPARRPKITDNRAGLPGDSASGHHPQRIGWYCVEVTPALITKVMKVRAGPANSSSDAPARGVRPAGRDPS